MEDDGGACPEVGAEGWDTRQLISLPRAHGCSGLQQVFVHVVAEVAEKSNFLVKCRRIIFQLMIMFCVGPLYVVDVSVEAKHSSVHDFTKTSFVAISCFFL